MKTERVTCDGCGGDLTVQRPVRTYEISVTGFPAGLYSARSPSKARAECWRQYRSYDNRSTFCEFLAMSTIRRVPNPPGVGERILICGKPATRLVGWHGQYVRFMRDDSDTPLLAHPDDVQAIPATP